MSIIAKADQPTGRHLPNASPTRLAGGTAGGSMELSVIPHPHVAVLLLIKQFNTTISEQGATTDN